ncbi:MAG: hypothetical protein JXA60_03240 [Candidatus Coatesbacteria bacterium]|nr:hypothetical protein [Candidatus Coatesbacteria bacterium]
MTKDLFLTDKGTIDLRKIGGTAGLLVLLILQIINMRDQNREGIERVARQIDNIDKRIAHMEQLISDYRQMQTELKIRVSFLERKTSGNDK